MGEFASPEIPIERNTKHVILIPRVLNTFNRMEFTIDENKSPVLEDGSASTSFLDPSVDWALTPVHKILAIQKQTEHGHFKRKFSCHFQDPSNFRQPPQPCKKTAAGHLNAPHTLIPFPKGPNQFLLFSDTLPPWTCSGHQRHSSIHPGWLWLILPPNDQFVFALSFSIFFFSTCALRCSFPPSHLFPSVSLTSSSCYFVDVQNMMKKWECRWLWHRGTWKQQTNHYLTLENN